MPAGGPAAPVPVTFEDIAVRFSAEEWEILEGWQKELHKEVMEKNYQLLISLGQSVPALALLSLADEREAAGGQIPSLAGERDLASDGDSSAGEELAFPDDGPDVGRLWDSGQIEEEDRCPTGDGEGEHQGSLHLSALMKLVKEIPEFLFGNSKATMEPAEGADSEAEMGTERAYADVKAEVIPETPHPPGLQSCLMEASVNRPSHPDTPSSCVSTCSTEGDRRGTRLRGLYAEEVAPKNSPLQGLLNCLKEIPINRPHHPNTQNDSAQGDTEQKSLEMERKRLCATEVTAESSPVQGLTEPTAKSPSFPSTPASSLSSSSAHGDVEERRLALGLWTCSYEAATGENSPLQSLLNCLKDIIVHKPRRPHPSPCTSPLGSAPGDPGQRRLASLSVEVKTEVTAEDPEDPGLESGSSAWPASKAGRPAWQASPPRTGRAEGESQRAARARSRAGEGAIQMEAAAESSPAPALLSGWRDANRPCPPALPACSSSSSSTPSRLETGLWGRPSGVKADAALEDSPLRGMENCLKELAGNGARCSHTPPSHSSSSRGHRGLAEKPRRGTGSLCAKVKTEAVMEDSSQCGLLSCLKDTARPSPQHCSMPTNNTSASSREREPRGVEAELRDVSSEEVGTENSPLRSLENCLKDIPVNSPRNPHGSTSIALNSPTWRDVGQGRPGARIRRSLREDVSPENSPRRGLKTCLKDTPVPSHSPSTTPASPLHSSSSSSPDPWRRPETAEAGAVSEVTPPLRGLENCLKDIPVNGPRCSSATASYFCASKAQGDKQRRRPVPRPRRACVEAASAESSPLYGLMSCLKDISASRPGCASTPSGYSSASSTEGESDLSSAGPGTWRWGGEEISPENSPLQGLEKCLKEILGPGPCVSSAPVTPAVAGNQEGDTAQRRPETGHWDAPGADTRRAVTADGHLQGLENCLEEIAGPRSRPSRSPPSSTWGDAPQQAQDAHVRSSDSRGEPGSLDVTALSMSDPTTESLALPWLSCWREITAAGPTPSSGPARSSSSASRAQGGAPPQRAENGARTLSGEAVLPADAPRCGPTTCPKGTHGNGPSRPNTLSGASFAGKALDQQHPRRPAKGIKRPHTEARTDAARPPGTGSCTSGDDGGQQADAEWEALAKRPCSSTAPSPREPCGCEGEKPLDLRGEISAIEAVLSAKLDQLSQDLAAACRDVSGVQSRMDQLERDSRGWALELAALQKGNRCLSETVRRLENRCHVLENRSHRNSLRLAGLPEGAEGGDPVTFLQRTLPTVLDLPTDSPPLEIESARRAPGGARWDPATRPRALVFRLLRFSDKLAVLRAVRKHTEPLTWGGTRVAVFPDVCPKLCRRRRARHAAVRRLWRAAELRFGPQPSGCCHCRPPGRREPLPSPPGCAHPADEQESKVTKGQ